MACRLESESVNIPSHGCASNVMRAVYRGVTSSARMMVRVSSNLAASMYSVVRDGMCTTAAPSRACLSMSKPYV